MSKKVVNSTRAFARAADALHRAKYVLKLYVAGITPKSSRTIQSVIRLCEEHLKGRYDLEIIDIYHQPTLAKGEQIVAVPTLIKKLPPPLRRIIGNMANERKFLVGLDLKPRSRRD